MVTYLGVGASAWACTTVDVTLLGCIVGLCIIENAVVVDGAPRPRPRENRRRQLCGHCRRGCVWIGASEEAVNALVGGWRGSSVYRNGICLKQSSLRSSNSGPAAADCLHRWKDAAVWRGGRGKRGSRVGEVLVLFFFGRKARCLKTAELGGEEKEQGHLSPPGMFYGPTLVSLLTRYVSREATRASQRIAKGPLRATSRELGGLILLWARSPGH